MRAAELIQRLNAEGIFPYLEGGRLKTRSDSADIAPELAQAIRADKDALIAFLREADAADVAAPPIPRRADLRAPAPLSFAQQRLWFLQRLDAAAGAAYHVPSALRLRGALDRAALAATLQRVVQRHDSLRTRFVERDGTPLQVIDDALVLPLPETDLRALDPAARDAAVAQWCRAEAGAPFDLAAGPLIRARLLLLDAQEHVLLLTLHHIVSDGWSTGVLVGEVSALYEALSSGRADPLPALPIQYADYAAWQRERLAGAGVQAQLDYWREHLREAPALLELPTDRPRAAALSYAGAHVPLHLDAAGSAALKQLARAHGCTLFMTVLAAWGALLSRLSGQPRVVVGCPVANRQQAQTEPLIGFFTNTLALQLDLGADPSVAELLAQARAATLGGYAHQDLPFEQVVEALRPERSLAYNPVFQVLLAFNNTPRGEALRLAGLELSALDTPAQTTQFDLALTLTDTADGLFGGIGYATDLFDRDTVARWAGYLERLLAAMARDPAQRVAQLPLLTPAQREEVLHSFNPPRTLPAQLDPIHRRFEAQAAARPHAIALSVEGATLSYAELDARANRLAHRLIALGVRPDTRVALCLERGLDLVVGVLGILKAGGGYVPLDPAAPADRLAFLLADSAPVALVTQADLALDTGTLPCVFVDDASLDDEPATTPAVDLAASHLAYVIYTSGSTGQPKGVMVEHGQVARLFAATEAHFDFGAEDVWTLFHSIAFDFSVWELWGALAYGGRLVVVPAATARTPAEFYALLVRERVTVLNQTPSAFRALIAAQSEDDHALRTVIFGGEALELHTLAPWIARNDPARTALVNMYGITEITVHATYRRITAEDIQSGRGSPIGQALGDLQLYVLDAQREPVPVGVTGELYVGGAGVARGYWNRAALTAERFLPDPFANEATARLYKTGDLGRWLADGTLEYLGRNDFQVKIRGFRIELGEIEARLAQCEGVREAVVLAREDVPGDKRLVAYVVAQEGTTLAGAALRAALAPQLAEYMLPSAFVQLETFPLTTNGKLDRRALPAPGDANVDKEAYVAPRDAAESALAQIWQDLLGLERVGIDDHFFRLGGHSLLATRLASAVGARLQRSVPVRAVFEHPTVRGLAAHLAAQAPERAQAIPRAAREGALPLSYAQQRLWFIDQLDGGSRQYHIAVALRLEGALDRGAFQAALDAVVDRHEVLRTRFVAHDGAARLAIDAAVAAPLRYTDLADLDETARASRLASLIEAEEAQPFDLARDPMLRAHLVRLDARVHVAVLVLHHIAGDGWSTALLVRDFAAAYTAAMRGETLSLPALPIQYADYAAWQRETLRGDGLAHSLGYWRTQLAGIPRLHGLPLDRPRPAVQRFEGGRVERRFEAPLVARLGALAQRHEASLFMLLQAAFATLLSRWSGETDIVMGSPVAGRTQAELEPLVGFFINTLVLRSDLSGDPSFEALLAQARRTALDAYAHQHVPFDLLVDELKPERSLDHAPVFQISFSFHNLPSNTLSLPGLAIADAGGGAEVARYDLELHIGESEGALQVSWVYATSLFDADTVARLADSFGVLLSGIAAAPQTAVSALPLLPPQDRARLAQWSAPAAVPIAPLCAHELFEAQARRAPQAAAVVCDGERLSYAELDAAANRVARYLVEQGVAPDDLVGLCVERSTDMLVGVLGILKAGAAYVPLDPTYPEERLAAMLDDAGVEHVLSQSAVLEALPVLGERQVLPLDAEFREAFLARYDATPLSPQERGLTPRHLAYAIYTSGSTGQPKGVLLEHRGLVNLAANQATFYGAAPGKRVLAFASLSFDGAAWEWLMALSAGATLYVCTQEQRRSAERLADFLVDHAITHAAIPPALLAHVPTARDYALEVLIVSGEACEESLAWTWAQRCRVCNSYGPSEATVAATHADILPGRRILLGQALDNVEVQVLNAAGQPQPVGVAGELYLGGAGLARGYLRRPALDAERFLPHPLHAGERLYRTGDLACFTAEGALRFLGRADDQVKIRGFRIELGEIEAQLRRHADVAECAVVARRDGATTRLVAYVVAAPAEELPNEALLAKAWRAHLKQQLPDYMLPAAFVLLPALPVTRNGKLDKAALPAPDFGAQRHYVAPQGEVETTLAAIWQQVLRVDSVGAHDNFFEIGGDSILSIQVVSRANQAGLVLSTKQLFEAQTIAELARVAGSADTRVQAPQAPVEGALDLLPIHHLFFASDDIDRHHYNQAVLLQTPAGFDATALRSVIAAILARHDALRLRFVEDADGFRAAHAPLVPADLEASCVSEALPDTEAALIARCNHWQAQFDLARGPLLRAVHFAAAQGPGRLLLAVHHAVVDGVSWRILLADLERAYAQAARGEAVTLAPKTSSFQQWGAALAGYAHGAALQQERAFWLAQCAQAAPPLPVDRATPDLGTLASTQMLRWALDADTTRALQQHCNAAYRTQIQELLLAGVYLGLRDWTGEAGLRLRLEGHGREALFAELDTTETVGYFTSVYPLALRCASDEPGEVIRAVKERCRAVPHHGIGYGILRYLARDAELIAAAEAAGEPALEFNYLGQFDQALNADTAFQAAAESVGRKISPRRRRVRQLGLTGHVFDGSLSLVLDYCERQYDATTMQGLLERIGAGLRRVIAHCQIPGVGRYTPSDFSLARVDAGTLDGWQQRYPQLSRLYPATPMQAGLLFEGLLDASAYVVQTYPVLRGALDPAAFRQAWQQALERHDVLRTAFVGEGEGLHQAVSARVALPWHEEDWRDLSAAQQAERFEAYRRADRARGFDPAVAPLLRIALFRLGEERWQLLWTNHHALSDGWSGPLIYRDVLALYQALREGRPSLLKAAPVYEHYIAWLQRQDRQAARAHWKQMLAPLQAPTPLPLQGLPGPRDPGAQEANLHLDAAATAALQAAAQARRLTVNTLLQWAWAWLLHRHSGETEVAFGATVSGRPAEVDGIEEMVGLFINTLPVRVSFAGTASLDESLATLQQAFQRSNEFGYLALGEVQQQSALPAGAPLFASLLVFENLPTDARGEALSMRSALQIESHGSRQATHYPLTWIATLEERLHLRCSYRGEFFTTAAIDRLLHQFERVLRQLPAALAQGAPIDWLDDAEREQVLREFNATAVDYPHNKTLAALFQEQVARDDAAIALEGEGQTLTYAQLDARANRLAHRLIALGVKPDACVALVAERSVDFVVGMLGVLKAGGAYVPLEANAPSERLNYVLADNAPVVVLTDAATHARVAVLDAVRTTPLLQLDDASLAQESETTPQIDGLTSRHLAYVIYTSGSTGQPKGVMVEQRSVTRLVKGTHYAPVGPGSCVAHCANPAFDASTWEVWSALLNGAKVLVIPPATVLEPVALRDALIAGGVTALWLTVGLFNEVLDVLGPAFAKLDHLLIGGDALDPRRVGQLLASEFKPKHLVNGYGPTETTTFAATHDIRHAEGRSIPIGKPIANTQIYILDAQGQPVPVGVQGELYIGGDGVARGYLNQPQLTQERFVADPFSGDASAKLYKTGDLGRWLQDGTIEYLGRNDFQVKLRGFRIELGEIEAKLAACAGVREAVVLAREEEGGKRLVAYVTAQTGAELVPTELRASLARELADYMLPSAFVVLDALPLTPNGKLDRQALPAPAADDLAVAAFVPPQTPTEERLALIWQQVLKLDRVSTQARFFELGGHSLLATRVVAAVQLELGCALQIKDLFAHPTIADLAAFVDALGAHAAAAVPTDAARDDTTLEEMEW